MHYPTIVPSGSSLIALLALFNLGFVADWWLYVLPSPALVESVWQLPMLAAFGDRELPNELWLLPTALNTVLTLNVILQFLHAFTHALDLLMQVHHLIGEGRRLCWHGHWGKGGRG